MAVKELAPVTEWLTRPRGGRDFRPIVSSYPGVVNSGLI
jgi:hypothetical protein